MRVLFFLDCKNIFSEIFASNRHFAQTGWRCGLRSMNLDFREGKSPEIMIHFRSSLLSMPSIRLQDFVLFSWIVKSLHSFHFMNESGFFQYLNFESQHNLFLLQWVVESQAPANKAHEPPGFIFHSLPQH